jgi:archaeosortase B (VPXXXP-CTERM-specific)
MKEKKVNTRPRGPIMQRNDFLRILLFILLLGAVAAGITFLTNHDSAMASFQGGIATITSHTINLFGGRTSVSGNIIHSEGSFALSVVTACTGLFTTGVFIVAVIAFPAGFLAKLIGVLLGTTGVFLINLLRLGSLFYVGVHFPNLFDRMHLLVWQSLVIVLALFLWLLWAKVVAHAYHS